MIQNRNRKKTNTDLNSGLSSLSGLWNRQNMFNFSLHCMTVWYALLKGCGWAAEKGGQPFFS